MAKKYTAQCTCGAVKFEFDTDPDFIANCHCLDCKRASGGEMATFFGVPQDDFTLVAGKPKAHHFIAESGKGLDRSILRGLFDGLEFVPFYILKLTPREFVGPLEGRALLAKVGVGTLQIRIAPRCARRGVRSAEGNRRAERRDGDEQLHVHFFSLSSSGAPVPAEPISSVLPLGSVRSRPFARKAPSFA